MQEAERHRVRTISARASRNAVTQARYQGLSERHRKSQNGTL